MATWRKVIVSGSSAVLNQISASGNIVPTSDNGADLGSSTLEWKDLYIDGTAYLDSATITAGTISGITDLAIADGGTGASTLNDLITMGTHTTGNYVATITGGTGIDSDGATSGESIAHSLTLDLNELGTETAIEQADFVAMVDATDDGSQKITFSNLEDEIFGNVSGDATVAAGGALTIAATSVEGSMLNDNVISGQGALGSAAVAQADLLMIDDGPGTIKSVTFSNFEDSIFANVSGDIAIAAGGAATVTGATTNAALTAGVGLSTTSGTFNGASAVTFALDLSELSDVQIASGDKLAVLDSDGANEQLESIDDIATLFAGTGLSAASGVISIDAADTTTTSIIKSTLTKIGTNASQEYIQFGTSNEVNTFIDNSEVVSVRSGGVDVTGVLTVSSNATIEGNLVVNGDTTTLSTTNLQVGDAFIFAATGSAASNVDGGLIVQEGAAVDSGSALYHDTGDNRWSVAKSIAATATAVTPLQHVVTVSGSVSTNPNSTSGSYGIGEMWITDAEDIWVRTA